MPEPDLHASEPDPRRWAGLAAALTAPFLGVVDFYVVNLALPALERDLGASYAEQELAVALYALGYAVFVVTGGRLGDTHGRRRVFLTGMAAFVATSCLVAAAWSPWAFLAARLLQGLAAGLLFPQVLALVTVTFPEHERPRALSYFGLTVALASITGQMLSGLLIELDPLGLGWRALFLINLPIGTAAWLVARTALREVRTADPPTLDLAGVGLATLALALVLVPLTIGHERGWPAWSTACLLAAPCAVALFLRLERRAAARGRDPLVDLGLFRLASYRRGLALIAVYFLGMPPIYLVVSLFEQEGLGRTTFAAALVFAPGALGTFAGSLSASRFAVRAQRAFLFGGLALAVLGTAALASSIAFAHGLARDLWIGTGLLLFGFGNSCVAPVLFAGLVRGVPARSAGSASGLASTVQQTASALGVAAVGLVFALALAGGGGEQAFARAAAWALAAVLCTMSAAFLVAARGWRQAA